MKRILIVLGAAACLAATSAPALAESVQKVGDKSVRMAADYNSDGKVSMEEHLAWAKQAFIQMDLDGDGYITPSEVAQLQMKRLATRPNHGKAAPDEVANQVLPPAAYQFPPDLDTDGDGKVSLAEHLAWETKNFKNNDLNGDGFITAKEIVEREKMVKAELDTKFRLLREQNQSAKPKGAVADYQK